MRNNDDSISEEHFHQKEAYNNYLKVFASPIPFIDTIYKDLYYIFSEDENLTRASLGDFYFEKYLNQVNENLLYIEAELAKYADRKNLAGDEQDYLFYHKKFLENRIEELMVENDHSKIRTVKGKAYENHAWFKVGVILATGEMEQYYTANRKDIKAGYTAPKIAAELGDKKYEKYILATMKRYPKSNTNWDKNIYNSPEKMKKIINYCQENHLAIIQEFTIELSDDDES
ncbi:MAG: hypothetical protein PSV16_13570 [Flavobacterium sp.]|nr:hypothetical protein [Flavobacterium sp.]